MAGIPVFNAPYSNTRSVAEMVLGEMIMLYRGIPEKSAAAHAGKWLKSAKGAHEVRGKKLVITSYSIHYTKLYDGVPRYAALVGQAPYPFVPQPCELRSPNGNVARGATGAC